tara:strand:- start:2091 stop:2483 length:393 start_codon:yes stop_codon:yes gene_type:complete
MNDKDLSLFSQISNYSNTKIDKLIYDLNDELKTQNKINNSLKQRDSLQNIEDLKNFYQRNNRNINYQVEQLEETINQLKTVVKENKTLEKDQDKYKEILNTQEYKNLASQLKKLKDMKQDIFFFLDQNGI